MTSTDAHVIIVVVLIFMFGGLIYAIAGPVWLGIAAVLVGGAWVRSRMVALDERIRERQRQSMRRQP